MKHPVIIVILFIGLNTQFSAYSQDNSDTAEFKIQNKFIDRNFAWYVNSSTIMMNTGRNDFFGLGAGTGFELKLWDHHSISAGFNLLSSRNRPWFDPSYSRTFNFHFEANYRYYHNLKGRMSKGLTGNNFNANYIILRPYFLVFDDPYKKESIQWDFEKGEWMIRSRRKVNLDPYLMIGYGIQRNIWNDLNLDLNFGFQINQQPELWQPLNLFFLQLNLKYIIN